MNALSWTTTRCLPFVDQNRLVSVFACLVTIFVLLTVLRNARLRPVWRTHGRRILAILAMSCVAFFWVCVAKYTLSNAILDHIEPTTMAVARLWEEGKPLYHDLDAAERYSFLYGPSYYFGPRVFISLFGPSIVAAKASAAVAVLAAVLLLFYLLLRESPPLIALVCTAYCVLGFMAPPNDPGLAYSLRADPFLIFWITLSLAACRSKYPVIAVAVCGIAAGMAINVKIHAILYVLPIVALLYLRRGVMAAVTCVAVALAAVILPFVVFENVSASNYLSWLAESARHGLHPGAASQTLLFGTFMLVPVLAAFLARAVADRHAFLRQLRSTIVFVVASVAAAFLVLIPASKIGAGGHHLMPLFPTFAFIMAKLLSQSAESPANERTWQWRVLYAIGAGFAVVSVLTAIQRQMPRMSGARNLDAVAVEIRADLEAVQSRFPDKAIGMGYGSWSTYHKTYYRPLLAFHGKTFLLDAAAMMDMRQGGMAIPSKTLDAIRDGVAEVWLQPRGELPFSLPSAYGGDFFGKPLRGQFLAHYAKLESTKHFDIWVYRPYLADNGSLKEKRR